MRRYMTMLVSVALIMLAGLVPAATAAAVAQPNPITQSCQQDAGGTPSVICQSQGQKLFGPGSIWTNIVNTMIFIVGAVAVIMIVIGGMKYTMSNGDASGLKSAKDTILYAIVGMVIAVLSYAIVNFVLTRI